MGATLTLLDLAGMVALLLWGVHMVQSGIQRAYGPDLRRMLGSALGNRFRAVLAGLGVTAALQSSTATGLMASSFAAGGFVDLVPALGVMLGANIGTTLIVQVLSFDVVRIAPLFVLAGVVMFRRGGSTRSRDLGRVAIGLGLMLLALHLMVEGMAPVEASPAFRRLLAAVEDQPLPNLLLGAAVALAAHSSVAAVLFVASLAGNALIGPQAALAMVLGANLGSALNPLLETGGDARDRARLRVPLGNLLNRAAGCLLGLAVLPEAADWLAALDPAPARLVANAHLGFNLAAAALAFPLVPATARLLPRLLPEPAPDADAQAPRYLDAAALGTPVRRQSP